MPLLEQRKLVRVLFDEFHSESWTISHGRAMAINPEEPSNSSYQKAADDLNKREFVLSRNCDAPLTEGLSQADVLVLIHPSDPIWEKTTSTNPPKFSQEEIEAVKGFVANGGGLLVISEYEHLKYGSNLNDLLAPFGLEFENTTVSDRTNSEVRSTWVFFDPEESKTKSGLLVGVAKACFYRAASLKATAPAELIMRSSAAGRPKRAGLIGISKFGKGRVVAVTDSDIFGDEFIDEFDHRQLWLNLTYWVAASAFARSSTTVRKSVAAESQNWFSLKTSVNTLRELQTPDNASIAAAGDHETAAKLVRSICDNIQELMEWFPHQREYLDQTISDFKSWTDGGFQEPDFSKALKCLNPQLARTDEIEHLIVSPIYTPNASSDKRFEALIIRVPWPAWLATIEHEEYPNPGFVPATLVDYTKGYESECAVFFPEMVVLPKGTATSNFGIIFCDREAKRYQRYVTGACAVLNIELPPQLECFLNSSELIQDTFALWDLIHDQSHAQGELPFQLFVERKKLPFWMYALEELRVDLRSFAEAIRFSSGQFPFALYVTYAVVFDRIFRFAITGDRNKNYDALAGQLLFSFLHKKDVLTPDGRRLTIDWERLNPSVLDLRNRLAHLYDEGVDLPRLGYWLAAHDLISEYVRPNLASIWKKDGRQVNTEDYTFWRERVDGDEFPLGQFYTSFQSRMKKAL